MTSQKTPRHLPLEVDVVIIKPEPIRQDSSFFDTHNVVAPTDLFIEGRSDRACVSILKEKAERERKKLSSANTPKKESNIQTKLEIEGDKDSATVIFVREKDPENVLPSRIIKHQDVKTNYVGQKQILDLEKGKNIARKCDDFQIEIPHQIERNTCSESAKRLEQGLINRFDDDETANRFLNELYDKKLNLENKFSNQEIKDIREAVGQHIHQLAKTIGKIDTRLKIKEIISVGSAREDTQIIRPCEFDYILILRTLSKPGAVSLSPLNLDDDNNTYMHVKLEDGVLKSVFYDISDKDYIRGSKWMPCFRQGLRDIFCSALHHAICLNSKASIKKSTGKLKNMHYKPETHGPAFMIRLTWEKEIMDKYATMELSVDLCPALKLDKKPYDNILPEFIADVYNKLYLFKLHTGIDIIETVLLMPRDGHLFKVSFTETELLCTSNLSQHHLKCYKLLKYLVNGNPFPRQRPINRLVKSFMDTKTVIHSYALKKMVWDHQFYETCTKESDLSSCVSNIIQRRIENKTNQEEDCFPNKETLSILRFHTLLNGLESIKNTPKEDLNLDHVCRAIGSRHFPAKTLATSFKMLVASLILIMGMGLISISLLLEFEGKLGLSIGMFLCNIVCIIITRGTVYLKRHVLALRASKFTTWMDRIIFSLKTAWVFLFVLNVAGLFIVVFSVPGLVCKIVVIVLGINLQICVFALSDPFGRFARL